MRKLNKPIDIPGEVLIKCISNYTDANLKTRLTFCKDEINRVSAVFEDKALNNTLHTLPIHKEVNGLRGVVTKDEMVKVYDDKFAKQGQPGREYYDRLLLTPKFKRCPLCGQGIVTTLDHHLPKAKYPALAITPTNLIPSCKDCNTIKKSVVPSSPEEGTIHPYFDDFENVRWLYARVIEEEAVLSFYVGTDDRLDEVGRKRIETHFTTFQLANLYGSNAAEEVVNRALEWYELFQSAGADGLREQLTDSARSFESIRLNSWQAATYRALAANDWFCHNGPRTLLGLAT